MSMSIENETQPLPPPCQRLVIRNLPFDVQEVDFLKYLSERKSCAAFLGSPANGSNGEGAPPRMILTSFKNGKAACKHKGRGTVCATAFVLAENAIVATTLAAALDSIAFNATTDPTLLMSVEYSVYQEAPVAGNAGGRHEAAAAAAGSIFSDPEYLQFVESTTAAQTAADVTTSTVSRDSLAKYAEERTQELAGKRETLMVKELLDNWFKKIPFAWERRGQSKQASSNQLSSSTSRDGKRGSGDQPSTSSTATSAKKKKKDRHGKEKHPEASDPALAAQQSKKKKDKSRKRDKKRKESSQGAPGDEGALSPEEIKRRAKREKDRERKSRKRREKSQAAASGDGAIGSGGLATVGETSSGKKSRKERQSGRGTSTDKATSSTPHDAEDASGSKKKRRDRSKKHSDRTQEGSGPSEDDRKAEDKKKRRDRKRDKRSGEAPQRNADGSIVVDGQVYPKSKEREILDRERDREAKQRRIKEKEDRARRQEQVLKDANAKASRKQRNSAAVGGGDAPSAPGGNGDDAGKKNTFTVTNTRRGGASTRKDMPSLGDSGDATPSHAPQGVWGSKSTASVPSGGAGDDRRPPPPPPAAGKRVMMRRPPPPPADA